MGALRCLRGVRLPPAPATPHLHETVRNYLLACIVEGKSYATIDCYADKLKGFLWYASNYDFPDNIVAITTSHIREFLVYLRDTPHRFNSDRVRAKRPINSTTIQRYYRVLSCLFNWLIREEVLESTPLAKIKAPRAERKVIKALDSME